MTLTISPPAPVPRLLTIEQVLAALQISRVTFYRHVLNNPAVAARVVKRIGGAVRIKARELDEWLSETEGDGPAPKQRKKK